MSYHQTEQVEDRYDKFACENYNDSNIAEKYFTVSIDSLLSNESDTKFKGLNHLYFKKIL